MRGDKARHEQEDLIYLANNKTVAYADETALGPARMLPRSYRNAVRLIHSLDLTTLVSLP